MRVNFPVCPGNYPTIYHCTLRLSGGATLTIGIDFRDDVGQHRLGHGVSQHAENGADHVGGNVSPFLLVESIEGFFENCKSRTNTSVINNNITLLLIFLFTCKHRASETQESEPRYIFRFRKQ